MEKRLAVLLMVILSLGLPVQYPAQGMSNGLSSVDPGAVSAGPHMTQLQHTVSDVPPVLYDGFNSSFTGFNQSLWDLETYGNGSVSWVGGDYFNMSAERHSFRALSSKYVFSVGQAANVRLRTFEEEAVICMGWTNRTAEGWNYLFSGDSVYFQIALSTVLLDVINGSTPLSRVMLPGFNPHDYHDYRIVWNSTAAIAYVDNTRLGVIGVPVPTTSLRFKIAITEFRNMTTEGWVSLDSVSISPHTSMSTENPPFIAVNSPGNGTTNLGGDPIDVVVVGSDGFFEYSWDNDPPAEVPVSFDLRLPTASGLHVLNMSCRDGYGFGATEAVHYVFQTQGVKPRIGVSICRAPPVIDGIIESDWSWEVPFRLPLVRYNGEQLNIDTYVTFDSEFLYVAIDSPVASGHDSRATIIVDGVCDGHYHGLNRTPSLSLYYHKRSPDAWVGYDELQFLNESDSGEVRSFKISPLPSGALAASSKVGLHVHYEFRLPLAEFRAGSGSTLGVAVLVIPSGMGVDSWFFPMVNPWKNASRLALADLLIPPMDSMTLIVGIVGVGAIAAVTYVGWSRWRFGKLPAILQTEEAERIRVLTSSHESIALDRLSLLANTSSANTTAIVQALIEHQRIRATFDPDSGVIRRK